MRRPCLIPLVILLPLSCVDNPGSAIDPGPQFDEEACTEFVVPQRMGLGWDKLNHRVSTWSVRTSKEACRAETLEVTHIGGDFSTGDVTEDVPSVKFSWQDVATEAREAGAARVTITAAVGPEGELAVEETFLREELSLRHYPEVVALVEGLRYHSAIEQSDPEYPEDYDPAHGYTIRAFGVGVQVTEATDEELVVRAEFRIDPANSPDRPDLNEAIPHARIAAEVDVLLVGINAAPHHRGIVEYSVAHPPPEPLMDQEIPPPGEDDTALILEGAPERPRGFWGLSSFEFQYLFDGSCEVDMDCAWFLQETCGEDGFCSNAGEEPGEYIREITVGADLAEFCEETGEGEFHVVGYSSNASRFVANFALEYDFSAELVWVQAGRASAPQTIEEQFETGDVVYPLP